MSVRGIKYAGCLVTNAPTSCVKAAELFFWPTYLSAYTYRVDGAQLLTILTLAKTNEPVLLLLIQN
jgi:hypothetical protein